MVKLPEVPQPKITWGLCGNFGKHNFPAEMCQKTQLSPVIGVPSVDIDGVKCPPWFVHEEVERLKGDWSARCDDVFLVFLNTCNAGYSGFEAISIALIDQCDVASVNLDFPRWIDAAVSRRGWGYIEAMDNYQDRRCFTTHTPPWAFPASNIGLSAMPRNCSSNFGSDLSDGEVSSLSSGSTTVSSAASVGSFMSSTASSRRPSDAGSSIGSTVTPGGGPQIAVFVADPRYVLMRDLESGLRISRGLQCEDFRDDFTVVEMLEEMLSNDMQVSWLTSSLCTLWSWALAEAQHPDRVRLFFIEDFVLQPEVALKGLASFLQVPSPSVSNATERTIQQAVDLINRTLDWPAPVRLPHLDSQERINTYIVDFEKQLAAAPDWLQGAWQHMMERWLQAPNPRMAAQASYVLQHQRWDPPRWWAAHSARLCRPCLYFPRGKCTDEQCTYCHGPGHHKPKRPPKSRRNRRTRYDRTPSPDARAIEC
mmetsp:Transcript_545/g.1751  ORF Transcript_545/g.1751 Transcript_545/m.1751 type:complete len:480 (+) Transcript_545:116-1555(+)